jgi:P-type Cu2+ transporter
MTTVADRTYSMVVLHVGKQYRASEKLVVERALRSRPGVIAVEANPAAQTATVTYDPQLASVEGLSRFMSQCGFECAALSALAATFPAAAVTPFRSPPYRSPSLTLAP